MSTCIKAEVLAVNTTPRRKNISNDLRDATVAAHQSEKGYNHPAVKKIIHRMYDAQRNCKRRAKPYESCAQMQQSLMTRD